MRKGISFVALTVADVCCVVAAYFCHFYYSLYRDAVTHLEWRMAVFDMRLAELEAHKSRQLTPVHIWGVISTADQPADEHTLSYSSSEKRPDNFFEAINAKGGPLIRPELRLPTGSSTNFEFDIQMEDQFGSVADAWLSHGEPYQELAAFEQFRVYCPNRTNIVRLNARPKPGASIKMRFDIVVLCGR